LACSMYLTKRVPSSTLESTPNGLEYLGVPLECAVSTHAVLALTEALAATGCYYY
jgi:hypothetical protein